MTTLFPRAIVHIFESKEDLERDGNAQYHIEVSYVEIYNEEIRDLLNPEGNKKLEIKGNSGAIQGISIILYLQMSAPSGDTYT